MNDKYTQDNNARRNDIKRRLMQYQSGPIGHARESIDKKTQVLLNRHDTLLIQTKNDSE